MGGRGGDVQTMSEAFALLPILGWGGPQTMGRGIGALLVMGRGIGGRCWSMGERFVALGGCGEREVAETRGEMLVVALGLVLLFLFRLFHIESVRLAHLLRRIHLAAGWHRGSMRCQSLNRVWGLPSRHGRGVGSWRGGRPGFF